MTNNFTFKIREWPFSIKDFGPQMNQQYQNIYDYYISGKELELGKPIMVVISDYDGS